MKHFKIVLLFAILFSFGFKTGSEKINARYLGFEYYVYPGGNLNKLNFEIKNNTLDTLYISNKNLSFIVKKGKIVLKEDKSSSSIGSPFFLPRVRKQFRCEEKDRYEKEIEKLKLKFAKKLYQKNFSSTPKYINSKDFIIENIVRDCIVLIPNEAIDYDFHFRNEKFDKTCKVSVKYSDNKRFTYFVDDKGKKIDINN